MFTKKDYEDYFVQIKKIEDTMKENVGQLLKIVKDKSIRTELLKIKSDEIKHSGMVSDILKIISK